MTLDVSAANDARRAIGEAQTALQEARKVAATYGLTPVVSLIDHAEDALGDAAQELADLTRPELS